MQAEIAISHDELRRASVDNIKQQISRFEKSEVSLCSTSTFSGITRAFGTAGSGSTSVMGQFRAFVDDYGANNCCPPAFIPGRTKKWPLPIVEHLRSVSVASKSGVFAAVSRVWVAVDNKIILWNYATDDVTHLAALPANVVAVHLAEPRRGVFLPTVQYVLVVATPRSVHLIGMTSADGGDLHSSDLVPLDLHDYVVTTPSPVQCITSHRRTGRIFAGGADGYVYEVLYSVADELLRPKLSVVNRSIYFGGTAIINSVGRALASLRQTWVRGNSPIVDIVCSDDRNGTMFALARSSATGKARIETWTVEEDDVYASATLSSTTSAPDEAPADKGAITLQCVVEHEQLLTQYLQEPSRRTSTTQQPQVGGGATAGQQQQQGGGGDKQEPLYPPLVCLQLPSSGNRSSGGVSSSSSSSSSSSGTVVAVDATGARYFYNAASAFSLYSYHQSLEMKLTRREIPLRFADGADTGSRRMRCCALGGDSGGAFCAVHESDEGDVVAFAGPNLLPFAPGSSNATSPSEVVSMFSSHNIQHTYNHNNNNNNSSRGRGGGGVTVHAVADCPQSALSATGKFQRHFLIVHSEGITQVSALRPVDMVHSVLLAPPALRPTLLRRVNAVASPADVSYLLVNLLTTNDAPEQQQRQQSSAAGGGGGGGNSSRLAGPFRTCVFRGTTMSASAPASPQPTGDGGTAAGAVGVASSSSPHPPSSSRLVDEGRCAAFELSLLERLSQSGAPTPAVNQAAFELLKSMASPVSMTDSHSPSESSLTIIFSPLSGGIASAVAQSLTQIHKSAPIQTAQGSTPEKRRYAGLLAAAEKQLQSVLDVMDRMKGELWNPMEESAPFLRPSVQVAYDDSAVNVAHARSCGSAVMKVALNSNNQNQNQNQNQANQQHNNAAQAAHYFQQRGFFVVAPTPTMMTVQDGHWLQAARLACLYRICDAARQLAHFWRRAAESVAPAIILAVSQRIGATISFTEMLLRKEDATAATRTLVRALLAEERNAVVPNYAIWNDLLADFERSCPALYNVADSLESRATLDIHRLARAGTEKFADRSGADRTLQKLAQQADTQWKSGSLEPICWQLHRSGSSVDAVVLLLRAAARLDPSRADASSVLAMRAVTEGALAAGDGAPDSFKEKLKCLDCLHALLEDVRRSDEATFDLFFTSTRTGANVPPGWSMWEVEPQDRVSHMSVLAWLSAPRDNAEVSKKLRSHVTGVYGGHSAASSTPYINDFFDLQAKIGGGHSSAMAPAASVFSAVSLETARYQWHTRRAHAHAVQTYVAFSQSDLHSLSITERLQTRLDVLREAQQCAREGRIDTAQIAKTISQLDTQRSLLEDIKQIPVSSDAAANDRYRDMAATLSAGVIEADQLFRMAASLPCGAGCQVQLAILTDNGATAV